jgi:hypothetical protein
MKILKFGINEEMAGYVENVNCKDFYYMFPEYFKRYIVKGFNHETALKALLKREVLELGNNGGYIRTETINGKKQQFYVINSNVFKL